MSTLSWQLAFTMSVAPLESGQRWLETSLASDEAKLLRRRKNAPVVDAENFPGDDRRSKVSYGRWEGSRTEPSGRSLW